MSNSIGPKTALLLYNIDQKTIEGVYTAVGAAAMNINREAWGKKGAGSSYPAQIAVKADPNYKLGSLAVPSELLSRQRWGGSMTDPKAIHWLKQQMLPGAVEAHLAQLEALAFVTPDLLPLAASKRSPPRR